MLRAVRRVDHLNRALVGPGAMKRAADSTLSNATKKQRMETPEHFDIIVIGSGGGTKIASPAYNLGKKVAIVESGFDVFGQHKTGLGGTCLNRGCIPSKMLIHAADVAQEINEAKAFSIFPKGNHDAEWKHQYEVRWKELVDRVSAAVDKDSMSINPVYEKRERSRFAWFKTRTKFVGEKTLLVDDGQLITGDKIFIATGSRPSDYEKHLPGLAGTPYLTSTEALRLDKMPKKLIVIGGGYIATELAHFYGGMGVDVQCMVRSSLIKFEDTEVATEFQRVFSGKYDCHFGYKGESVSYDVGKDEFSLKYADETGTGKEMKADSMLVAIGVTPNADELDLHLTGVDVTKKGFIQVDDCLRTSHPDIWAFGDVAGNFLFRHSANFEGQYLLTNVVQQEHPLTTPIDYTGMPHAVFSNPQVAGVGEREDDLLARGADYVKGVNPYAKSAMGDALRSDHGFVKLLIEKGTRNILGCHIVGREASVLVHQVIPLMRLGGRLDDLLLMVHIHPALNEIVRNAARRARDALKEAGEELPADVLVA